MVSVPKDARVDSVQLNAMAAKVAWTSIALNSTVLQEVRDAVSYNANYKRTVSSRLCLYYINSIRARVTKGLNHYLITVDGCESSDVVEKGICDIYYCERKPHTYELQLAEKAAASGEYGVTSIYKTVDQPRSSGDIQNECSNVDPDAYMLPDGKVDVRLPEGESEWPTTYWVPDDEIPFSPDGSYPGQEAPVVGQENPVSAPQNPAAAFVPPQETPGAFVPWQENPVQWQNPPASVPETPVALPESPVIAQEDPEVDTIDWSDGGDWAANPPNEEWPVLQPMSLRADAAEQTSAVASGFPAIAAIAGVAITTLVLVLALIVVRFRARVKVAKSTVNQEKSPLCSKTPNTADVTISMTNEDNIAAEVKQDFKSDAL